MIDTLRVAIIVTFHLDKDVILSVLLNPFKKFCLSLAVPKKYILLVIYIDVFLKLSLFIYLF